MKLKHKSKGKKNPFEGRKPRKRNRHKFIALLDQILLLYIVMNSGYKKGKLRVIKGNVTGKARLVIMDPEDTGADCINPEEDMDPVLFLYLGGTNNKTLRIVVCNINTPLPSPSGITPAGDPANPLTSTSRYTIYELDQTAPAGADGAIPITILAEDIVLTYNGVPVAGNPHGFVRFGDYIFIVDYDTTAIYRIAVCDLEAPQGGKNRAVELAADAASLISIGDYHHGVALLIAEEPEEEIPYLFALFNDTEETSQGFVQAQYDSTLVRYELDPGTGVLSNPKSVVLGKNATGLHIYNGKDKKGNDAVYLIIPCIGGMQNAGHTNGRTSRLAVFPAFDTTFIDPDTPITGDDMGQELTASSAFDIIDIAFSVDGANAYLLTLTYEQDSQSDDYLACWRVYKISNMDAVIAITFSEESVSLTLTEAVNAGILTECESAFGEFAGYYFNIDYQDAGDGKLWFMNGDIRISAGGNYDNPDDPDDVKIISGPYGPGGVEINSTGLACDLLYPLNEKEEKAAPKRAHKARFRTLNRSVRAAVAAARQAGAGGTEGGADEDLEDK
jgi:hypothetical protein